MKVSSAPRVLVEYALVTLAACGVLAGLRAPQEFLLFLAAPIIIAALTYPRRLYLWMLAILISGSLPVIIITTRPIISLLGLALMGLNILVLSEMIYRSSAARRQIEESLRASESKNRALLDAIPDLIFTLSKEGVYLDCHASDPSQLPIPPEQFIGKTIAQVMPRNARHIIQTGFEQALHTGAMQLVEFPLDIAGATRHYEVRMIAYGDKVVALTRDITDRKHQEAELERRLRETTLLHHVVSTATSALETETILQIVCEELARGLNVPLVRGSLIDPTGDHMTIVAEHLPPDEPSELGSTIPIANNPVTQYVIQHRASAEITDALTDPRMTLMRDLAMRHHVVSMLIVPLLIRDQIAGTISLNEFEPRQFSGAEIALAQSVGAAVSQALDNARLYTSAQKEIDEHKRAEEKIRRRADEFAALHETVRDLSIQQNLTTLLETIVKRATTLLAASGGSLYIYDPARGDLQGMMATDSTIPPNVRLQLGEGMAGRVAQTRQPMIVNDYQTWDLRSKKFEGVPVHAVVQAPMLYAGDLIGVLDVYETVDPLRKFDDADAQLLSLFAGQAAAAIHNARLLEETRQRTQRQETLYRVSMSLASIQGARESCQTIVRAGSEILGYPYLGIFLVDPESGDRVLHAQSGWVNAPKDWRLHPGEGLSDRAILTGELQYCPDVTRDPRYVPGLSQSRCEVDVPIKIGDSVLGVLIVEDTRVDAFGVGDFEVLQTAASQLAVALENARLYAAAQQELAERKRAEMELQVQRDFALQVMNTMGQGLVVTTADDHFEFVNPAFARMLGYTREELIGKTTADITFPEDLAILETANAHRATGEGNTYEMRLKRADGSSFYALITGVPRWRDRAGVAAIAIVSNLTERKQMERALAQARDQALEASRLKSEFLATMSHEIRTPMTGIIGMAEMLIGANLDPQPREFAEIIHQSANALLVIINDILDFSKIEAGKFVLDHADFELPSVIEGTVELLAAKAREKGLGLMAFVSPAIPRGLRGDPGRLRQILMNLIGNAVKFTAQGEVMARVELIAQSNHAVTLRFSVSDTGIGIPDAARKRLFQPFTQADGSMTRKYGGTGLGLAISRRLVELMNGQIGVESEEGKGATFWFTARFERAPAPTPRQADLHGLRVLIVDDIKTHRDIITSYVSSWGMCAHGEPSAVDALKTLRDAIAARERYDLAIVDLRMPDMDGRELARAIKQDPALASTHLILLTGFDERGTGENALNSGFGAYLTKPVRQSHLFDAIARVVAGDHQAHTKLDERQSASSAPSPASGKHILLAEDNLINQKVALLQLSKLGYTAQTVANGREAVHAVLNDADMYTLILMDCQMPEIDGFEATRAIRKAEILSGRHMPIIAMTANAMEGDRDRCIAAGMDDYLSKPVNLENLGKILQRWSLSEKGVKV